MVLYTYGGAGLAINYVTYCMIHRKPYPPKPPYNMIITFVTTEDSVLFPVLYVNSW